jgi:hypothetical protein
VRGRARCFYTGSASFLGEKKSLPVQRTLYPDETFLALLANQWNYAGTVHGVGLQRWWRALAVAFIMGQHTREGARSPLMLLRMTVGMV